MNLYAILRRNGFNDGPTLEAAGLPVSEIIPIADTVIVRPDPE
jgi:hypothetical protein